MTKRDDNAKKWPMNLKEAVGRVLCEMPDEDKEKVRNMSNLRFVEGWPHGFGPIPIYAFGLWRGNWQLLRSCGTSFQMLAAAVIMSTVWKALQGEKVPRDRKGTFSDLLNDLFDGEEPLPGATCRFNPSPKERSG